MEPPRWRCEDPCPTANGNKVCGTTRHFTSFALLLGGGFGGASCGSNDEWIIGQWEDIVLIGSCLGAACVCVSIFFIIAATCQGKLREHYQNESTAELRSLRKRRSTILLAEGSEYAYVYNPTEDEDDDLLL